MGRIRIVSVLVAGVAAAFTAGPTMALAAPQAAEDGADTFNVAPGTAVTGTNSSAVTFTVSGITITCTVSTFSGTTGTSLKFKIPPPTFSDGVGNSCTDSAGATDTFTSNSTNGKWAVVEKDFSNKGAGDEDLPEPNATGDKMQLHIPQAGLVDSNSVGCTFTFAPSGAVGVTGTYDDAGTFKITKAVPITFAGPSYCSTNTTATFSVTYTLSPAIFDAG